MTEKEALLLMETSKDVQDWNEKREEVKSSMTPKEWRSMYPKLDNSGLIVKILNARKK